MTNPSDPNGMGALDQQTDPRLMPGPLVPAGVMSSPQIVSHVQSQFDNMPMPAKAALHQAFQSAGINHPEIAAQVGGAQGAAPSPVSAPTAPAGGENAPEAAGTPSTTTPDESMSAIPMQRTPRVGTGALPEYKPPTTGAQNELSRLQTTGSGVSQIQNPLARIPLQILDAVGSGLFPKIAAGIPGTSAHHSVLVNQAENQVGDEAAQQKTADEAAKTEAETEKEQAQTGAIVHPDTSLKDKFQTAGGGIYNLAEHKWEVPPPEKDKDQLLEVNPDIGKNLGLQADEEGKYYIPPQAAGSLLKPKEPKEPKEGELPLGDRVGQINEAMKSRYQILHPGAELPTHYVLPPDATQKDFDRTDKLIEGEEKAFGTKANQEQTNELRKQTMALAAQNKEDKGETAMKQAGLKAYTPAMDSAQRFNVMTKNYEDAVKNHDQQAMLSLLTNHIGMTMGMQKGARITKDILSEAEKSQPWIAGVKAKFDKDGYLSGVNLSPEQMRQMVDLGRERFSEDVTKGKNEASYVGVKDEGPERTPNKSTMNHYLGLANGDVNKAKELAGKDGWTIK